MKSTFKYSLLAAFISFFTACSDDNDNPGDNPLSPDNPNSLWEIQLITEIEEDNTSIRLNTFGGKYQVNWGNGTIDSNIMSPKYSKGSYTITVKGKGNVRLACNECFLTSLDLSKCPKLTRLECDGNNLITLNLSNSAELTYLSCENNQLSELDMSKLSKLTNLACRNNQLTELDVSACLVLQELQCQRNQLTTLTIGELRRLKTLNCDTNKITTLDLSQTPLLDVMQCSNNRLSVLNLADCRSLTELHCENNQLTALEINHCPQLTTFYCNNNPLSTLDATECKDLKYIDFGNGNFTEESLDAFLYSLPERTKEDNARIAIHGYFDYRNGHIAVSKNWNVFQYRQ